MSDRDDAGREAPPSPIIAPVREATEGEARFVRWLVRHAIRAKLGRDRRKEDAA